MNDKTKILYDQLTKDGYDIGDYNSFSNNVKDDNKRKTLYNTITNDGYDVGDYDTFSAKLVGNNQPAEVDNMTTTPQPANTEETFVQNPKVRERILANTPDYFKSKGNNLSTLPLGTNIQDANDIAQEEQQRVALAERSANDPYMRQQEFEHVFKPKNQEQINAVNKMIADARRQRAEERNRNAKAVKSDGLFSTLSQAYVAGEQNDTDKQLEYASTLMEEAQNITNESKKKGNTNFFSGFARGFKNAPLDGWAMGLQDLKNYSAAKKVLDKVDKGEQLNPAEDALMQALVTNAATKMYYSGDLGRGYKAGSVTAESLPFMLDMIAGMGTIQAVTKPASKALVKYATEKAAKYGLGKATTGLAKGAARTITGLGDVAAHTATFGGARVAADYQRRGMGDIQVSPNMDGTVSYAGRDNVQTGAEAIAKSAISTAAETGTELLGEYFSPMLGWVGKVTGANKIGKIIPASVGKAYSNIVNSQGFKNIQELAQRAKIADPIGEYGEEVVNNLISTAIGDMTPEELVDLDQNIDTFLGVAPMSVLFGAAGTGGYLREKYKNYRDIRTFENQMQETMGEDWSGVKEALQDADIETARNMVKDVLSSDMQPDMKKRAINYISSVLQEQTLQEIDKQQMPQQIAAAKKSIISNMQKAKDTLLNQGMSESDISRALNESFVLSNDEMEEKYGLFKAYDIYDYLNAYTDYADYNYWVQNKAYEARKEAESQVEKMTNATTGTVMRVNSGLSKNPVNVLRGNIVFDNDGNVDQNQSDNTIYYLADDGKVKMAPISMFQSLVDDTPAEGLAQQVGQDAEEEVLQGEEAQINSTPEGQQQQIEVGTRFNQGGNNYEVMSKTADGYVVAALDADGNPMQSQQVSEGDLINAINSQNQAQPEQPVAQPDMNAQPQEGQTVQTEQPATQQTPDQPATAMSRIPLNEKGEQDFEKAPVEDTSAALIEISDSIDDAKDTAQQMIDSYNNELKKADKAKTTGSSIQEIVRLKQEKKANLQAINDKIEYWNKVASQIESQRPGGIIAQAEEEAKANQQRLDNMTQEQQQAAQQEVQKKIESGAYEKKQPRKRVRYVKEDSDMGESVTPLEHVLREIATGRVTFNWNDSGTTQGLGSHLGLASSPEERKKLIWALSSDGMTPEAAAEQIHADMPENLQGMVTDQDIFNMILNSFQEYGSPSKMWEEAKRMHGTDIEENIPGYDEDMERMQLEWEAENNGMTVSEWIDYCDYIEEKINDMYSSVSDEELNTIFEQIYNEYEQRRTETESAGSTEGQPDDKQGDEVLPASESDNAGTGAEVEEQPQPANQVDGESGSVVPEPEGTVKADIEKAREDVDQNPTEAQKEAGNYKKGHVKIDGYDVTIENPKGSVRSGKDANGNEWSVTMNNDYGYIRGTEGVDGDHIDVFLSDDPESGDVFVIDQVNPDGSFDEHKVMYGFKSALAAKRAYLANYSKGWTGLGNITRVSKEEFKKWIDSSNRKTKPFAEYKSVKPVDNNKVTSVEEFMKNAESDYSQVERPSEEDLPELKKIANNVLQKGKNKFDITTEEGYNEMSATFEGIYPKEKALLDKYRDNGGVAWVDYDDKCVYRINYDPAKYKGKSDKVTVIKEYFKEKNNNIDNTDVNKNKKVNDNITEKDIQDSPFEQITKDGALAYLRGNVNFATSISYQQIYNYVRNRSGNNQSDSGAGNPAQPTLTVDETTRRESRPDGVQAGEVARENDNSSSSQNSKKLDLFSDGEGSDTGLRGKESSNDGVSSGDTGRKRSGRTGSNGRNVRKRAGERISKSPVKSNPERGGNSTSSERDGIIDEINSLLDDFVKAGNETASLSAIGMNPKQIEIAGKLLVAGVRLGYTYIKDGITKFNDWMDAMKEKLASPFSSAMKLTDAEIDEFIKDMWEYPHTVNGETRPLKEWASIMEADTLRNSVRSSLEDKRKLQEDAENIPVKVGDKANIVETLPYLLPQQQDDVFRAETQFFDQSHNDRDHAFGKGYLFTNGTGTGKTYTGLGIAKRFIKQGKDRILILTPSQAKVNDWINDAKNLGINLTALESTKDKGTGPVITTFANLRTNKELMKDAFDLVIYDESHRIMENKKGEETAGAKQHYMLTNKNVDEALRRIQLNHPLWIKEKELLDELKDVEDQINPGKNPPEKINEYKEKRKELSSQLIELQRKQKEVLPEMENQAKEDVKRTKVVFLSATPFNTIPSLSYAEGYIFSYPEENKNTVGSYNHRSPRALFLEQNFGAGYKWRYGGIENSIENPEALSRQEVQFSDYLENVLGTKSGRIIDSEYDYSRDFPTVTFDMAPLFNQAIEDVIRNEELNILYDAFSKVFFDYNYSTALFETMKIAAIMPRIRKHLEMGRKVVVFHRRVESKTPLQPPFELSLQIAKEQASEIDTTTEDGKEKKKQFFKAIMLFRQKYGKLLYYEQKMNYSMPRKQVADAFGADNVLFFSGNESKTYKNNAIKQFNDDNSGKDIIVIQESSGKEGISLHDTTGKHQRVLITLALPQSPITALQIEGRIYRIGNKSNAIFEYPLLGLNLEKILFGKQFNNQVSTTENLALGSKARNLRDSFAEGVVSNSGDVPLDRQGVGGKEFDNKGKEKTDAFDNSISDYYGTQKLRPGRNNRSGIDYFPTPEPVGYKMVEWARLSENEDVLEPSAGHGAIARYVPKSNGLTAIEPSTELFPILQLRAGGQGRKFVDTMFENYNLVNKFDAVLMNPPYGTAGRTAIDHIQKAFNHLNEGGRVIAIIPRGSADSKFDKWYESEKGAYLVGEVLLPSVTFNRAGTSVSTRIVVIDKVTRPEAAKKVPPISRYDLSGITDIDGNDGLFEAIRNIQMPERTIDQTGIDIKNAKKTLKDFKDIKSVYEADVDEQGVTVRGTYGMNFVQTFENIRKPAVYYAYKKSLDELRKESDQKANVGRSVQERISFLDTVLATIRNVSGKTEEQIMEEQSKNANSSKLDTLYEFVPDKDTRNNNDIYLAKPYNKGQLSKDQYREIANLAKKNNGYWSSFKKAFLFNSESDARSFLNEDLNSDENGIRFREDNTRSIVDPFINDLMKEYAGEDLSRYPFEDKRTDPNNDYNVYWGYSEPLYNGKNIDGNEEVPEVIRDIIRNDEYEIDKQNIIDTLKRYIEFNEGFDEELEYKKVLDWFQENKDKFSMSHKVNLIVDRDSIPDNLYRTSTKLFEEYPLWLSGQTTSTGQHTTQITGTVNSYKKIGEWIKNNLDLFGKNLSQIKVLDASSGLGVGTKALRDMGLNVEDVEPYPSDNREKPTYLSYNDITDKYDVIISNAVLNVIPDDWRADVLKSMADKLNLGGKLIINVRDAKEIENQKQKIELDSPSEILVTDKNGNIRAYQKGFSNEELTDWVKSQLGDGWLVQKANEKNSGLKNARAVVVTRNNDAPLRYRDISSKSQFNNNIEKEVKSASDKLNIPVEVITSPDQIKDQSVRKAIESGRKVKGWYSISEGKVYLYLPNATSMEDAVQTLLHEGVAHYGLRRLVGEERMDDFLDDIFTNASKEVRQRIIDTLPKYGYNSRIATEEYMARMAEKGVDDVSFWDRIKQAFKNLLRRIGININVNDNELRYILWRSRQNLNMERPLDMAKDVAMQYQMGVGNYYRDDTSDGSREAYEKSLQGWRYKAREAYQDSMLALKNLQDVIAKVSGKPIQGFENAYIAENQLSSRNTTEARRYNEKFFKPLMDAEGKLIKKYGLTHKAIERYMMLAHGIERNVEMTFREQLNDVIKNNPDDAEQFAEDFRQEKKRLRSLYSGYEYLKELTDYIGEVGDYSATKAILQSMDNEKHDSFQDDALDYVKDFENTYNVKKLWDKTNRATKETLRKSYESGMMSKDHFANVSNMFMYYVPLRGWNEKTAEDVYEYINSERSPVNSVLKSMRGRKSIPDEIMATIGNMAESAIVQGNRNMMKQAFMNMVMNHPTDLATLKKAWYVYDPATDEWNISFPDIEENDTPETIAQKIQDHDDIMKKLKDQGIATQKSSKLNINYKITKGNAKQHVVQVKNGGKDYLIYVNANPRAAQAVNGLTNPDAEKNPIFNAINTANRWLAANFTTRNPAFVMSNLSRDIIFSMAAINIKEDGKYSARFRKNIFKAMPVIMRNLRGNDKGTESDKYFKEFIENGGETGYMHLTDVNEYKKKVRQELRKITGKQGSARAAFDYTLERLEDFNRWAEDVSRFSVYMTSRQMGRSIVESINDAKEVTVNFNKKGAGYKTGGFFGITAGAMRNLYLFFNASVQSLTNFNRLRVKNPAKFYSTLGGFMAAGFLMPVINNLFHSIFGDGDDPYNDLPEWVRRNNLCIYAGDGKFVTIPLPIELRAFYGLGDYAYQLISGREKPTPAGILKGTISQLADLLPLNPTGNEGFRTFMPDALSPIFETYVWNEDFTGKPIAKLTPFNERDPEWKRVYKGTSAWLVDTSKFLNDLTNGDEPGKEFRKGFIDFNPAKVEHLFESYFGGMAKFLNQAGKTIYYGSKSLIEGEKDDNLIMRNVPALNRFVNTVDERNAFSGINTEYFNLRDEMEQFKYELNGVKKNFRKNPEEYRQMVRSDMFQKYMKYKPYQKKLDKLYQMGKEQEGEERKQTEDMITETRRELLQAVK